MQQHSQQVVSDDGGYFETPNEPSASASNMRGVIVLNLIYNIHMLTCAHSCVYKLVRCDERACVNFALQASKDEDKEILEVAVLAQGEDVMLPGKFFSSEMRIKMVMKRVHWYTARAFFMLKEIERAAHTKEIERAAHAKYVCMCDGIQNSDAFCFRYSSSLENKSHIKKYRHTFAQTSSVGPFYEVWVPQ